MLLDGHQYVIRFASKMFITHILFIDWMNQIFLPSIEEPRCRLNFQDSVVMILDGHTAHATPHVMAFATSRNVMRIELVPRSPHISQPLAFCVFGPFLFIYQRERQTKRFKCEMRRIYRTILSFFKATIVPMVRFCFSRAGLSINLDAPR
jgi:hypothetical protein